MVEESKYLGYESLGRVSMFQKRSWVQFLLPNRFIYPWTKVENVLSKTSILQGFTPPFKKKEI